MVEHFLHPKGLLFFKPFWNESGNDNLIELVEGEIKGEGPWKVGDCVITVAGCHGSDPDITLEFSRWQDYVIMQDGEYMPVDLIKEEARKWGAIIQYI